MNIEKTVDNMDVDELRWLVHEMRDILRRAQSIDRLHEAPSVNCKLVLIEIITEGMKAGIDDTTSNNNNKHK
ncbi:MAG: hypothetical protein SVK08_01070 [Halobacteriota archaeon]|nr:hypothetical protein [Halobacteriota archaeon]